MMAPNRKGSQENEGGVVKTETKMLWGLLLLPIFFGEVLSGNFPPLRLVATYGTPLIAFFLLYGCGTLLMHELRARWKLQWSLVFLAVAYALFEEGIATKAFWNPGHGGPESPFSSYGYFYGVKWVWMFHVGFYHATLSSLAPLFVVTLLWPEMAHTPLLGKKGFRWALAGFSFVCLFGFLCFGETASETNAGENEVFYPSTGFTLIVLLVLASLIGLAHVFRHTRIRSGGYLLPPWAFGVAAAAFEAFFLLIYLFPENQVDPVITIQIEVAVIVSALVFTGWQVLHRDATPRHHTALIIGAAGVFIAVTPLHEFMQFTGQGRGMLVIGFAASGFLWWWRRRVLARVIPQETESIPDEGVEPKSP